MEQLRALLQ